MDGGESAKKLAGDVGEHGRAARGDAVLDDELGELRKEIVHAVEGIEIGPIVGELR